jgi:hypothetical protein
LPQASREQWRTHSGFAGGAGLGLAVGHEARQAADLHGPGAGRQDDAPWAHQFSMKYVKNRFKVLPECSFFRSKRHSTPPGSWFFHTSMASRLIFPATMAPLKPGNAPLERFDLTSRNTSAVAAYDIRFFGRLFRVTLETENSEAAGRQQVRWRLSAGASGR